MKFSFDVKLTDNDYLDFNRFWMIRSPYGKKQIRSFRIMLSVLYCVLVFLFLFNGGFSPEAFLGAVPIVILLVIFLVLFPRFLSSSLKWQIKALKKSGKMAYSPEALLEFYEEYFTETTPENKTEQKYTAIEQISLVENKMIYIHVNNVMAYLLPVACFESEQEYEAFLSFIKTKCENINVY